MFHLNTFQHLKFKLWCTNCRRHCELIKHKVLLIWEFCVKTEVTNILHKDLNKYLKIFKFIYHSIPWRFTLFDMVMSFSSQSLLPTGNLFCHRLISWGWIFRVFKSGQEHLSNVRSSEWRLTLTRHTAGLSQVFWNLQTSLVKLYATKFNSSKVKFVSQDFKKISLILHGIRLTYHRKHLPSDSIFFFLNGVTV